VARRTVHLRQYREAEGIVGIDGPRVYVLHPDAPTQILEMPHKTEADAEATLAKVLREYFNSRHGWTVWLETDHIDTSSWIPPPPAPPTAAELAIARAREIGYHVDGATMVLSLSRNSRASDLEMALERAADVSALHVLISEDDGMVDDEHPTARYRLFEHLVRGAAPKLTTLTLESPWARGSLAPLSLAGLGDVLQQRRFVMLGALGVFEWPDAALPCLAHVRLQNPALKVAEIARIATCPDLRVVQLRLPKKAVPHRQAIVGLPLAQLDELVVEYVPEFAKLMMALLDAGAERLPRRVHLHGLPGPGLDAALARWRAEADGSELTFGPDLGEQLRHYDVRFRDSPFDTDAAIFIATFGDS
jgi:hypothetical protein